MYFLSNQSLLSTPGQSSSLKHLAAVQILATRPSCRHPHTWETPKLLPLGTCCYQSVINGVWGLALISVCCHNYFYCFPKIRLEDVPYFSNKDHPKISSLKQRSTTLSKICFHRSIPLLLPCAFAQNCGKWPVFIGHGQKVLSHKNKKNTSY